MSEIRSSIDLDIRACRGVVEDLLLGYRTRFRGVGILV